MNGVSEWIVYLWLTPALLFIILPLALLCFWGCLRSAMFVLRLLGFEKRFPSMLHDRSVSVASVAGS
jgi:hypothetical protein